MAMAVARADDARHARHVHGTGGVRLFTRSAVTHRWVANHVLPSVRDLQEAGLPELRVRHGWLGGPHVDVVAGDAPAGGWAGLGAALDAGPATEGALDPADYLDRARALGRLEAVAPPYLPMREHGAVEVLDAADVARASGPLAAAAPAESLLCAPLIDTIDALARDARSATVLLAEAFVALAGAQPGGLAHGASRFRAHAGAFLDRWGTDRDLRSGFAARLASEHRTLQAVLDRHGSAAAGARAAAWSTAFASSVSVLRHHATAREPGATDVLDEWPGDLPAPAGDAALRLVVELFHRQLALLAVTPVTRYYLYYALGELAAGSLADGGEVEAS